MRQKEISFPEVAVPDSVTSARIWHCRYKSLIPLSQMVNLRELVIASYPDSTLELLAGLVKLERLEIVHLPKIRSLSPLSALRKLKQLSLSTLPSWDSSGKVTVVESLQPVAELPELEELSLFGVLPESKSIEHLLLSKTLRRVRVSKYPP
ncbi:hypothetical protein KKC22_20385, partial [Myxococcota bacterium]|nr:hypothetical protein [Myxococcota bacterium]